MSSSEEDYSEEEIDLSEEELSRELDSDLSEGDDSDVESQDSEESESEIDLDDSDVENTEELTGEVVEYKASEVVAQVAPKTNWAALMGVKPIQSVPRATSPKAPKPAKATSPKAPKPAKATSPKAPKPAPKVEELSLALEQLSVSGCEDLSPELTREVADYFVMNSVKIPPTVTIPGGGKRAPFEEIFSQLGMSVKKGGKNLTIPQMKETLETVLAKIGYRANGSTFTHPRGVCITKTGTATLSKSMQSKEKYKEAITAIARGVPVQPIVTGEVSIDLSEQPPLKPQVQPTIIPTAPIVPIAPVAQKPVAPISPKQILSREPGETTLMNQERTRIEESLTKEKITASAGGLVARMKTNKDFLGVVYEPRAEEIVEKLTGS